MSADDQPPSPGRGAARAADGPEIAVVVADDAWREAVPGADAVCREAAAAALAALGFAALGAAVEVGVRLTGDAEMRALNRRHRGRDAPTNVLSFPLVDCAPGRLPARPQAGAPLALGDVVVGCGRVRAEAAAQGKPCADHLRHLVVHGVLHLAGHDHDGAADAAAMEALEADILAGLGVPDPYAPPGAGGAGGAQRAEQRR